MGTDRTGVVVEPSLRRFAHRLRATLGAERVLLFGSRARAEERPDSDYDVIVVASAFVDIEPPRRAIGLRKLWYAAGGEGSMDLICVTPQEFEDARQRITLIAAVLPEAVDLLPAA